MITAFSTRNAIILAALLFSTICWSLDTVMMMVFDDASLLGALFPEQERLIRRSLLASTIALAAAFGCGYYSNALRQEMRALGDFDVQYRSVLEATFDSIITLDASGCIVGVNASAAQTFAGPQESILNRKIDKFVDQVEAGSDSDLVQFSAWLNSIGRQMDDPVRVNARRLNGTTFPAEVKVMTIAYSDITQRIVFIREVSEQVNAEQALSLSESRYRDLFEKTPDGVFRSDDSGRFLAANEAFVRLLRYESESELRRHARVQDVIHSPDQSRKLFRQLNDAGEIRETTVDINRRDGSVVTVRVNITVVPMQCEGNRKVFQATVSDYTELSAATDALRDSEEHFRALAENSKDIITVVDEHAIVMYCSPSSLGVTGFTAEEHLGKSVFARVHEDDRQRVRQQVRDSFDNPGNPITFSCRLLRKDGSVMHAESVGRAFVSSAGEIRGVINTRDISERRRTNQQLQQAQKMQAIGQLTGGIAHDFNNLLTVIVGNLQLIEEETDEHASTHMQVDTALRAALQGADLTRQLLAFARRQPLEPKVLNTGELLVGMQPLLQRSLGESMSLNLHCTDDLWWTKVDPTQLESAILNLVINARDATDGNGNVRIELSNCTLDTSVLLEKPSADTSEFIRIAVRDNGIGMAADVKNVAIEPFFSTKNGSGSSGLGLSMVYGFVQQSGGYMRLDSVEGEGTTVELFLPRSSDPCADSPNPVVDRRAPNGKETVLVVDDHKDVRNAAVATITRLGYEVLDASSGPAALRLLQTRKIDLLFSDIKMPEMSGFELANKTRDSYPKTRILLTSGFTDGTTFADDTNRFEFLRKPYNKHELATRIRGVLDEVVA